MTEHDHEKLDYQAKTHLTASDYRSLVQAYEKIGLSQQSFIRMVLKQKLNELAISELSATHEHENSTKTALREDA